MSWKAYVDNQILCYVKAKQAIIASIADGTVWARKEDTEEVVSDQELKVIADTMRNNPKSFQENGIHLAKEKYFCLSVEGNIVRGRKGSSALSIVSTKSCLLVVTTVDGFAAGTLNSVVEGLADYLTANHF